MMEGMERSPEYMAFIRDLMPDASKEELELAMQNMDDYIRLLMRIAERADRMLPTGIRMNPEEGV